MHKVYKDKIRKRLISDYAGLFSQDALDIEEMRRAISSILNDVTGRDKMQLSEHERHKIIKDLLDEFTGYGPIDGLLKDNVVTEIMINGPKKIYIEKEGKTMLSDVVFDDDQQLMALVYKILSPTRRRVDESYPYTEVSMKDGSRINIIIPPLALDGPVLTIRKFLKELSKIEDIINMGTLDNRMAEFLVNSVQAKLNIIFAGATGAGKTTTLNVLSSYISNEERIVTIEDTAELRLNQDHVVRLETRQPNIEGKGEITIRQLFHNSLRMRPDRIILGEIRGSEALDLLQAICSGHTGSLSVIHADSPQDVIYRVEAMILTSGIPLTLESIHRQIAAAINIIVQQEQLSDGTRKITHIAQVNGFRDGHLVVEDLFRYKIESVDEEKRVKGHWEATGIIPVFYYKFKELGISLSEEIFKKD